MESRRSVGKQACFEYSLCLSRICLGKMSVSIYKWLKTDRFRIPTCSANIAVTFTPGASLCLPIKRGASECFPYLRPKPGLVKRSSLCENRQNNSVCSPVIAARCGQQALDRRQDILCSVAPVVRALRPGAVTHRAVISERMREPFC